MPIPKNYPKVNCNPKNPSRGKPIDENNGWKKNPKFLSLSNSQKVS